MSDRDQYLTANQRAKINCYSGDEGDFMEWSQDLRARWSKPLLDWMVRLGMQANHLTFLSLIAGLVFASSLIMRWLLLIGVVAFVGCGTSPSELKDFQSDGCSAFPDGTLSHPRKWRAHCLKHDLAYWQGGTHEQRREADLELMRAVRAEGHPVVASFMYPGMRIGGAPWWPTPWRWGFGWSYPRGYGVLNPDEQRQVNEHLAAMKSASANSVFGLPNSHK